MIMDCVDGGPFLTYLTHSPVCVMSTRWNSLFTTPGLLFCWCAVCWLIFGFIGCNSSDSDSDHDGQEFEVVSGDEAGAGSKASQSPKKAAPPHKETTVPPKRVEGEEEQLFQSHMNQALKHFQAARLQSAERSLRAALKIHSDDLRIHRALSMLLNSEGRRWEAIPHSFELVKGHRFTVEDLLLLGSFDEPYDNAPLLNQALKAEPESLLPLLGLVRLDRYENRDAQARERLLKLFPAYPNQLEVQAQFAGFMFEHKETAAFTKCLAALSKDADTHPEIWFIRGQWAEQQQQPKAAARCYWEAAKLEPNHRRANFQLGVVLNRLKRPEDARPFLDRAQLLGDISKSMHPVFRDGPTIELTTKIAQLNEQAGRIWEAWAWHVATIHAARQKNMSVDALVKTRDRLRAVLDKDQPPRTLISSIPSRQIVLADYPLPKRSSEGLPAMNSNKPSLDSAIRFDDLAHQAKLSFTYYESFKDRPDGMQIMDGTGGGVAVLDFDQDGWPDLCFAQGRPWPPFENPDSLNDRLFRNRGDGTFQDVTEAAGISGLSFSQGCTSGDFNNDGWPDLMIANIGDNQLYLNNGDGTFDLVPLPADPKPMLWTTSCAIVDLNADGLPDLYAVNYLGGKDVYTRRCGTPGNRVACGPNKFDAEQDRFYLNLGDGTWKDVTVESKLEGMRGKGLGVIAADFDSDGSLELFIANDVQPNYYFVNKNPSSGEIPEFSNEALLRGLAFNRNGRAQACMGVAIGDANGDQQLDLFVTNFFNDSNTLYVQQEGNLFVDHTQEAALRDASLSKLGFGTQFVDADLDGDLDLLLTNGHIEDLREDGVAFRMPAQVFLNGKNGIFEEVKREQAGTYFQAQHLGRGMAVLDWNRDGRDDVAVSNIGTHASLATNMTTNVGHFFAIKLRAKKSARDGYGTRVILECTGTTLQRQLTAGNGYQACNQRQLVFGVGNMKSLAVVTVVWPSGQKQVFKDIQTDREWLAIEGITDLLPVPKD